MLQRIHVARHERAFVHQGGDFARYLRPGTHWLWGWAAVHKHSTRDVRLSAPDLEVYLKDPAVWDDLVVVDLAEDERAIVWVDGRLHGVLGPDSGRVAFWKDLHKVEVERFDAAAGLRLTHPRLDKVLAHPDGKKHLLEAAVPRGAQGLLVVDEQLVEALGPGRYAFWRGVARVAVTLVDLREETVDVAGQEILTRDKVTLRLNLVASFRVEDAQAATGRSADFRGALYRDLQLALREAVGGRTLDELLAAKEAVGQDVERAVRPRAAERGLTLGAVGIRDVILPGEMKVLLNQVIEAEKRAEATSIQRREETAATRSLLNTAKLIEQSPTLLRLKELETAERMAASIDQVQILGGGVDALVRHLLPKASQ